MNPIEAAVMPLKQEAIERAAVAARDTIERVRKDYADIDSEKCKKFVEEARKNAAEQYDLFVEKLNQKIGVAITARLEGNHVWSYSFLYVTTPTGDQCWKTQQIINQSKYGKLFNQFPSRKVKNAK